MKYHVELIKPELSIFPKSVLFPVLPEGEKFTQILMINNKTNEDYICEWLCPPLIMSGITIMPKVFELPANGYTTCIIQYKSAFRPYGPFSLEEVEKSLAIDTLNTIGSNELLDEKVKNELEAVLNAQDNEKKKKPDTKKIEAKKAEPKKDKKQLEEEERKRKEEEEKLVKEEEEKRNNRIKEFDKNKELKMFGAEFHSFDEPIEELGRSEHWKFTIPLCYKNKLELIKTSYFQVSTTCVENYLSFDKEEVNFGEVSVKNKKIINVVLTNKSDKPVDIKMKPLIISNCFSVINSVREIPSGANFNFVIEFYPLKDLPYIDEFVVYTDETVSSIRLKGIGVCPEVSVNIDKILFIGNAVINNTIEKTFELTNKSAFSIEYEIKSLKTGKKNKTGIKPFTFVPYKGTIGANGKVNIKVSFIADHQDYEKFYELILINVPNQKTPNYIFVSASSWYRQLYWKEYSLPIFPEDSFYNTIEQDYFTEPLKLTNTYSNDRVVLLFPKVIKSDTDLKRKLTIGNCRLNDLKCEKNGTFDITIPVKIFLF